MKRTVKLITATLLAVIAIVCAIALVSCNSSDASVDGAVTPNNNTDCKHNWLAVDEKISCAEIGYRKYKCDYCSAERTEEIEMIDHTEETIPAVAVTCTTDGATEGKKCSVCNKILVEPTVIKAGHDEFIVPAVKANCVEDGLTEGKQCFRCGEILLEQLTLPKHPVQESFAECAATCTTDGYTAGKKCSTCGTVTEGGEVILAAHKVETLSGYAATCTSNGLTDGSHCSVCKTVFANQTRIYSNGHNFDADGACLGCDLEVSAGLNIQPLNSVYSSRNATQYQVVDMGTCTDDVVVIPETYNGGAVVAIADNAFEGEDSITKVVLPASIISIGDNAFDGCSALEEIECKDFEQIEGWSADCLGDADCKIKAIFNGGKTPYEIYIDAMNNTGHNYDRFVYTSQAFTYFSYNGIIDRNKPVMEQTIVQKQCVNDYYFYRYLADYGEDEYGNLELIGENTETYYFVNNYICMPNYMQSGMNIQLKASLEAWYGMTTTDSMQSLTEDYFKSVDYYKGIDGKMYLVINFDADLMLQYIEKLYGESLGVILTDVQFSYVFDAEGRIESYTSSVGVPMGMADINGVPTLISSVIETTGTFSELGTLSSIDLPTMDWTVIDAQNDCSHSSVVAVPALPASCYMSGRTAGAYCEECMKTIIAVQKTDPAHNYVNGECSVCGKYESGSTGLAYILNNEGTGYIVVGLGGCRDIDVIIPETVYGLPVVAVAEGAFDGTEVNVVNIDDFEVVVIA